MVFSKKSNVLNIEIKDKSINKQICRLILDSEKKILELKGILEDGKPGDREKDLEDLRNMFLKLHREVEIVSSDIVDITNEEAQKKDFIRLNDGGFLNDKNQQIWKIKKNLNELIGMLEDRPTIQELEAGLLKDMITDVNVIIEAMNNIIADDKELERVYKSIKK